jgi:hypothetical protein
MTEKNPYKMDYPGWLELKWHDGYEDLKRWFYNYRTGLNVAFCNDSEWLVIDDKKFTVRNKQHVHYTGQIGSDHYPNSVRKVDFEIDAPPPPTFMQAPKRPKRLEVPSHISPRNMYANLVSSACAPTSPRIGLRTDDTCFFSNFSRL